MFCRAKDEEAGEVPMAFVLKRQGSMLSEAAVIDYVAKQVPYLLLFIQPQCLVFLSLYMFSFIMLDEASSTWFTFFVAGCTIQESEEGDVHTFNT